MESLTQAAELDCSGALGMDAAAPVCFDKSSATFKLLGMTLSEINLEEEESRKLSSQRGVVVLLVERNMEAYKGGVKHGDFIAEVNSIKIGSLQDLRKVLRNHNPRDPLFVFLYSGNSWRFTSLSFISGRF